jgi:hypothetical protein
MYEYYDSDERYVSLIATIAELVVGVLLMQTS